MKSTNGDSCLQELSDMKNSEDICVDKLADVIRVELPEVKKVTSNRTICDVWSPLMYGHPT